MITLSQIPAGKVDAKNELQTMTEETQAAFLERFVTPPQFRTARFLTGDAWIVTGMKGTGKTAFLRYLAISQKRGNGAIASFLLFKKDFGDSNRERMAEAMKAPHFQELDIRLARAIGDDISAVWRWVLYRMMASGDPGAGKPFFTNDSATWQALKRLFLATEVEGSKQGVLPTIVNGTVKVNTGVLGGELSAQWNLDTSNRAGPATVTFADLVLKADDLFRSLRAGPTPFLILVDELEFNAVQIRRDAQLIAGLLDAAAAINARAVAAPYPLPIRVHVAVRTEVAAAMSGMGLETNKLLSDFGEDINWARPTPDISHPLIRVISSRIHQGRTLAGLPPLRSSAAWYSVFPGRVFGEPSPRYLLHRTWFRPRDIVRCIAIGQRSCPEAVRFDESVFTAIHAGYSRESWQELQEELSSQYDQAQLGAIEMVLNGWQSRFTFGEFRERCQLLERRFPEKMAPIRAGTDPSDLLTNLYRVGVIGNTWLTPDGNRRRAYAFRESLSPVIDRPFTLHLALRHYFSLL